MATIKEKAAKMLENTEVVVLSSVNKDGYPRPVPLSKIQAEGISTIWMATGSNSVKTKDFRTNPKAGLCFYVEGNSVALTGEVEIVTDTAQKQELWQDWFIAHFPEGPTDPNYVLLKFRADHATFWIDGEFIHRQIKG